MNNNSTLKPDTLQNGSQICIAVSCGDINGVAPEIILKTHGFIRKLCRVQYAVHRELLEQAAGLLKLPVPDDIELIEPDAPVPDILPGRCTKESGKYSFASFEIALKQTENGACGALVTMPVSKKAWQIAGIPYVGYTDALSKRYGRQGIMTLGRPGFYVSLYTDHIPLKAVPDKLYEEELSNFLLNLHASADAGSIAVTGLNPHAGEEGLFGQEDKLIRDVIGQVNRKIGREIYRGPFPGDSAFTPAMRSRFSHYVAMYHDQGLIPVKTLFFEEAVNISLNLPVKRVSPDHGTAFDIAYCNSPHLSCTSYIEAVKTAVRWTRSEIFMSDITHNT